MRCFLMIFLLVLYLGGPVWAQTGYDFYIYPEDSLKGGVNPHTGLSYAPPAEPSIAQVKFLKIPEASGLQEQIDRLVHGITMDIAPSYDHYGYELRRYMAHVGNPEIYKDSARREEELNNTRNARIILAYWIADLRKRIADLETAVAAENVPSSARSSLTYNKGVINAFQVECEGWLDANEAFLKFLTEKADAYSFEHPYVRFYNAANRRELQNLYLARDAARKEINQYASFAGMVY